VINETCIMPRYERQTNPITKLCNRVGRIELIRQVFAAARATDRTATLILNDFDTSPKYESVIRQCLDAGIKINVIGIQSHMHVGYWGRDKLQDVCDRFARFGLPLHFTELTLLSGALKTDSDWHSKHPGWISTPEGEARQAQEVEETYRTLFAHPAVQGITWWDFADFNAWQAAPSGLVRQDMTPKPAYEVLLRLVKGEWWTGPLKLGTDAAGRVKFRGVLGQYTVKAGRQAAEFAVAAPGRVSVAAKLA